MTITCVNVNTAFSTCFFVMTIDFLKNCVTNLLPTFNEKHGHFETISVGLIQTIVSKHHQEQLEDFEYFVE